MAMAAMARAGDGANMAGKVGEALAAVGVEPHGSFFTPEMVKQKRSKKIEDMESLGSWFLEEQTL